MDGISGIRFSTTKPGFYRAVIGNLIARRQKAAQSKAVTPPEPTIALFGHNSAYLSMGLGLDPQDISAAARRYLTENQLEADVTEISSTIPQLSIIKRTNAYTDRREKVLVIPEELLARDPGLTEPEPRFTISPLEQNVAIFDAPAFFRIRFDRLLATLKPREASVIRLRFGFSADGICHSWNEAAQILHSSRKLVRQYEARALKKLRHPSRFGIFREFREDFLRTAALLLENDAFCTIQDIHQALEAQGLAKMGLDELCNFLRFERALMGREDLFLSEGKLSGTTTVWESWEALDMIIDTILGSERAWRLQELRGHLAKIGIDISSEKLFRLIKSEPKLRVNYQGWIGSNVEKINTARIAETIKQNSPLHIRKIAEMTGLSYSYVVNLTRDGQFVSIGMGIVDLLENRPELRDIPFPDVKRHSFTFAAVYGILREFKKPLKLSELYLEMNRRGYQWGDSAVSAIIKHEMYRRFFNITGRGWWHQKISLKP
ncbi:MAG: sigma factor-like helix-turn-helix DNA-binding protein [Candidatus Margulisbacteria bacterium]|nr:sigma factor-like helix-turn-helix DNA-binding protein [Candidatus Margulisiibacteriota bacterium]